MYAVLDLETTGGQFNEEGITEIAIYKFDGHEIIDQFISLVNPEKEIQDFVVKLTGINNKMLVNAPKFFEIAKRIVEITKDCTLVAHNTSFDYRVLKNEFNQLGFDYERNTLCTVELSKKLIQDAPSYSLGKLTRSLGIPITDRHRASGDALATVKLFKILLDKDADKSILKNTVKYFDKRIQKARLNKLLDNLPPVFGIYYIHNTEGKVIYIGRGKNINKELNRLFLKDTKRAVKVQQKAFSVSFDKTGNELFNRLKFYLEVEKLSPKYNFRKKISSNSTSFNNDNFLIVDKGREPEENAIILIENNAVHSYGYTNLAYQENNLEILKTLLTPIHNKEMAKSIVKNYIARNKVKKLIRF